MTLTSQKILDSTGSAIYFLPSMVDKGSTVTLGYIKYVPLEK